MSEERSLAILRGGPMDGTVTTIRNTMKRVEATKMYIGKRLERVSTPNSGTYVDTSELDEEGRRVFILEETNE